MEVFRLTSNIINNTMYFNMKKFYSIPMLIAATAMAFSSCTEKEKEEPVDTTPTPVFIEVKIVDELNTKATVATEDDELFTAAWEDGDEITITYSGAEEGTATATYNAEEEVFEFEVPAYVATKKGDWSYTVEYGITGNARTQEAGEMNGKYDLMSGTATATDAVFARVDNDVLSVEVKRQTALLYFHITALRSAITETVTAATLKATNSNGTTEIALAVNNGPVMNNEDGMVFWFNVPAGEYSALDLDVETASFLFETETDVELPATLVAGTLTKTLGAATGEYTLKEGTIEHGDDVFDSCDYSPVVSGVSVLGKVFPSIDTENKQVGKASFKFEGSSSSIIGPFSFVRETPLTTTLSEAKTALEFWLYTETEISGKTMRIELGTGGAADTDDYEWEYKETLAAGWNKILLPVCAKRVNEGTPKPENGYNFVRMWIEGFEAGTKFNINIDNLKLVPSPVAIVTPMCGTEYTSFLNSHPVFSADKKTVYVLSGNSRNGTRGGYLCAIDLESATLKWMYDASHTNSKTIMVNPTNGDVIFATTDLKVRCLSKDGVLKWQNNDINVFGSGLALNGDGSVVILAGHSTLNGVNNRDIWSLNAADGTVISMLHSIAGQANTVYCGNAEVAFVKEDNDYEYLVLHGNELMTFIKMSKTDKTLSLVREGEACTTVNIAGGNKAVTDICSPAVSPDKKYVFFPLQDGYISVADIETMTIKGILFNGGGRVSGIVFNANGDMITTANKWVYKFPSTEYLGKINENKTAADAKVDMSPAFLGSTPSGINDAFNYSTPGVAQSGAVYAAVGHASSNTDWGKILKWANSQSSSTASILVDRIQNPGADAGYQACFAMTDNYLVLGNKGAFGCITIVKIDDVIAPNTWGYFGGDPCATKNVKWVYGSY